MLYLVIPTSVARKTLHLIRRRLLHAPHRNTVFVQEVPVQPGLRLGARQLRAAIRHGLAVAADLVNVRTAPAV